MDLRNILSTKILVALKKLNLPCENLSVSFSSRPDVCDFQTNYALITAKKVKKNPIELAEEIVEELDDTSFSALKGFINIKVSDKLLSQFANDVLNDKELGIEKVESPRKLLIDYGGANVAKELHVGHLRSPIIGEALKRLHRLMGDTVLADTHLGDWGMQMGLTVLQLKEDGYLDEFFRANSDYESIPLKNITLDTLNDEYPKASKRKDVDVNFKKLADDYTLFIQQKREPYYTIYKKIRAMSVEEIKKNYSLLNKTFC